MAVHDLFARQRGHTRTAALKNFEDHCDKGSPSSELNKVTASESKAFVAPCWQHGMRRSAKFFRSHAALHAQLFREMQRQLTALYGAGFGKELLIAGDALIKVSWKTNTSGTGSGSAASASSTDPCPHEQQQIIQQQFFLVVPRLSLVVASCRVIGGTALVVWSQ